MFGLDGHAHAVHIAVGVAIESAVDLLLDIRIKDLLVLEEASRSSEERMHEFICLDGGGDLVECHGGLGGVAGSCLEQWLAARLDKDLDVAARTAVAGPRRP